MPLYDYECGECSFRFEVKRGFHDTSGVRCPKCQCESHRVFTPVPIIFKGSGFYVTDMAEDKTRCGKRHNGNGQSETSKGTESIKSTENTKKAKGEKVG